MDPIPSGAKRPSVVKPVAATPPHERAEHSASGPEVHALKRDDFDQHGAAKVAIVIARAGDWQITDADLQVALKSPQRAAALQAALFEPLDRAVLSAELQRRQLPLANGAFAFDIGRAGFQANDVFLFELKLSGVFDRDDALVVRYVAR